MNPAAEWLEESASVWRSGSACKPPTLIRSWTGSGYVLARCPWCKDKGVCPLCRTGHDNGKCAAVDAA